MARPDDISYYRVAKLDNIYDISKLLMIWYMKYKIYDSHDVMNVGNQYVMFNCIRILDTLIEIQINLYDDAM